MRSFKRFDINQVNAMRKYIKGLQAVKRKKPLTLNQILFSVVYKFRSTGREICSALNPVVGDPSAEWMKYYTDLKRRFNNDERQRDREIIAVRERVIKNGKKGMIWVDVLAAGQDAANAAEANKPARDGYNDKIDKLIEISRDTRIRHKHKRYLKEIEEGTEDSNEESEEKRK